MTGKLETAPAPTAAALETDPVLARAQFFFDLELMELSAVIPQAAPRGVQKY